MFNFFFLPYQEDLEVLESSFFRFVALVLVPN